MKLYHPSPQDRAVALASIFYIILLPPATKAKIFSGGLQHNTCLQYPGYALLVKIVLYVFCSCIMMENKFATTTTMWGDYACMDGRISELKNQIDTIGDAKNSSTQHNITWVSGGDRGLSSVHNNYGKSLPLKRASSAGPDHNSSFWSNVCFYCQEPGPELCCNLVSSHPQAIIR